MRKRGGILTRPNVDSIVMPENVRIGLMIAEHRAKCKTNGCDFNYHALAFGQSPFHIPPPVAAALAKNTERSHYSAANGIPELREAIAGFNKRHFNLDVKADDIFVGPGVKGVIHTILSIIEGDLIIPSPTWIGYQPIAKLLRKESHILDTDLKDEYKVNPKKLDQLLSKFSGDQHLLVINNPHNPTGALYSEKELEAIIAVCRKYNVFILADEIYALTTYDFGKFTSIGTLYPEGTFTLNGLAKDRSAGGYRIGYTIFPTCCSEKLRFDFKKIAATVYTNISTPHQYAAVAAYEPNTEIEEYFDIARNIHRIMGRNLYAEFDKIEGLRATKPEGGFYFFLDFNDLKDELIKSGVKDSNSLGRSLLAHPYHFAMVTGDTNLIKPDNFGGRIAFVDYDGRTAFEAYRKNRPKTEKEEFEFFQKNAPNMTKAGETLQKYVNDIMSKK